LTTVITGAITTVLSGLDIIVNQIDWTPLGTALKKALGEVWPRLCEASPRFRDALMVMEVRTVAADDLWLSPFFERDTLAVHATWISDWAAVEPALAVLQDVVAPFDPRPHWGKVFTGWDADDTRAAYPMLPRFRELADRLDPRGCFVNDFVRDLGIR